MMICNPAERFILWLIINDQICLLNLYALKTIVFFFTIINNQKEKSVKFKIFSSQFVCFLKSNGDVILYADDVDAYYRSIFFIIFPRLFFRFLFIITNWTGPWIYRKRIYNLESKEKNFLIEKLDAKKFIRIKYIVLRIK